VAQRGELVVVLVLVDLRLGDLGRRPVRAQREPDALRQRDLHRGHPDLGPELVGPGRTLAAVALVVVLAFGVGVGVVGLRELVFAVELVVVGVLGGRLAGHGDLRFVDGPVSRTHTLVAPDSVCVYTPLGCQTVFVSRKATMRSRPGSAVQSSGVAGGRRTRLRFSAAAASRDVASAGSTTPVRSIALTSMWLASHGAVSAGRPVSTFTTPPGTSDVASTSASVIAGSGRSSLVSTTAALPVTITGARTLTRPSNDESAGATTPTTPVGSGVDRLKYGPATGFADPYTCAILSDQPAYQTQRSIAASTAALASSSHCPTSATNCARRPSSSSATR